MNVAVKRCRRTTLAAPEEDHESSVGPTLMSPAMAAAAAVSGRISDVCKFPHLGGED